MDAGNTVLLFSSGDTELCYNISIINDQSLEPDQTFMVILSSSDPNALLLNNISVVTIQDDNDSK